MNKIILLSLFALALTSCEKEISIGPDNSLNVNSREILFVQDSCFCFLPNVFSPDGNNLNDTLRPLSRGLQNNNYSFTIRSKAGTLLFTSQIIGEGWGGGNQAIGTYDATVKGTFSCGNSFEETTRIRLIKNCVNKNIDVSRLVFENMFSPVTAAVIFPSGEVSCP
jgi:hypothetical protein